MFSDRPTIWRSTRHAISAVPGHSTSFFPDPIFLEQTVMFVVRGDSDLKKKKKKSVIFVCD